MWLLIYMYQLLLLIDIHISITYINNIYQYTCINNNMKLKFSVIQYMYIGQKKNPEYIYQ